MKPDVLVLRNVGPFRGTHTVDFSGLGDIFLVYGKTGAGKTTIFDAISYALYGEAPGERKGIAKEMRSQFADRDEESAVSFSFLLARKRWRVTRTLPYEKIGARSGKLQTVAEEVTLEEWDGASWKDASSANKSDTNARVVELVGLSLDEFSRIVLLPQGEFARFLRLNSNERKAVLSKLFPVGKYARVTELARDRSRELTALLKETEQGIASLRARFDRGAFDANRAALSGSIAEIKTNRETLRATIRDRSALLEKARAASALKSRERELSSRLDALLANADRIERDRARLANDLVAGPLAARLDSLDASARQAVAVAAEIAETEAELSAERKRLDALEASADRIKKAKSEKEGLLLARERLRVAVDIARDLERETAEYEASRKSLAAASGNKASIAKAVAEASARLAAIDEERGALDARNEDAARARDALELARRTKTLADEAEAERKARDAHAGAIALLDGEIAEATRDGEIARAELEETEREAERARAAESAFALAATLEDGIPCPVCGSPAHPNPAIKTAIPGFSHAERIAAGKRRIDSIAARVSALEKTKASREADLAGCEARLEGIAAKAFPRRDGDDSTEPAPIPTPADAAEAVKIAAKSAEDAQSALARSRAAWREAEELSRKASALSADAERADRDILALERSCAELKAIAEQRKARYLEAFPQGEAVQDPEGALERCEARILEIDAEIARHEDALKESRGRSYTLSGRKEALAASLADATAGIAREEASLKEDLSRASFADARAVRDASLSADERAGLERAIAEHDALLAETKGLLDHARLDLSRWDGPDAEAIVAEIEGINATLADADARLEERSRELAEIDALKGRDDELERERAERSLEAGRMASLASDLTGNNPIKTGFDAWILAMYLEEITRYANERLERMSEGRYRIQLNDSYRRGNAYAGLELEILDAYTGKARPSATLSGGETFMTSISLALGLADSIQSRSGGVQLDAVFIDEGFGSLDESSLERAITILDEIRGSRMVGLVSHVVELRSRIPNRIEVVKTVSGSSIRKELHTQGEI